LSLWSHSKAALSLTVITLNLAFWFVPVLGLALVKWAIPGLRSRADVALEAIYRIAVRIDDAWLKRVIGLRWNALPFELARDENVIVLANHASWADILLMQSVVARDGPILKFLTKRELAFIPLFGAIFWAFDFPMLRRRTRGKEPEADRRQRDLAAIKEACRILAVRPAALVNFAEGTRSTEEKRREGSSFYTHLLEPKVGGFSALLDALEGERLRILDLTLKYPGRHSFWNFLSGEVGAIEIEAAIIDAKDLPETRDARAVWLADRWAIKDQRIDAFLRGLE
jgi:1-acyl-sn-glycerol-3-phosphate acyltransferase